MNGSGLLDSVLNPAALRSSMGRVNDYIAQIERKGEHWGASLRFGIVSPVLYTDAQFVTAATPRQGVEATLTTPAGKLGFYTNTNDEALGGGAGITFHQRLMGASLQAPFPKWAEFRLMWLSARDIGAPTIVEYDSEGNPIVVPNPVAQTSRGDVYGGLLNLHLPKKWQWQSEYAWSYDNANLSDPTSTSLFGRAWRTGLSGQAGKAALSVDFRDLSPNFGNPANPSLTQSSNPDLRGVDASANPPTKAGTFAVTYSFLQNNVQSATAVELDLNSATETWSKPLDAKTNLSVSSTQSITKTGNVPPALQSLPPSQNGSADQRDVSGNIKVSRQVGMVSLNVGGTRDWLRNNIQPSAGAITSSISAGANLVTKGFFQCNTQANIRLGCCRSRSDWRYAQHQRLCRTRHGLEEAGIADFSAGERGAGPVAAGERHIYQQHAQRPVRWAAGMDASRLAEDKHALSAGKLQPESRQREPHRHGLNAACGHLDLRVGTQEDFLRRMHADGAN